MTTYGQNTTLAVLAHVLAIFTGFIGPLIMYLVYQEHDYAKNQIVEALNFQITVLIAFAVAFVLAFVLIGIPLMFVIGIVDLIFCIMGAVKASSGKPFRYPISIRILN